MQFPRFRIYFTVSENSIRILDFSLLGLALLSCYGLYKSNSKKKEEKQKLRRFKYLYTTDDCQLLKIDSKEITVQGQINSDNHFLLLKSVNHNEKITLNHSILKQGDSFQIFDPQTKSQLIGKIKQDCQFEKVLFNYHQSWQFQTFVSSEGNCIVRLYKKIINYFFGKTLVENIEGIDLNQYFIFKGVLKQIDSELMLEIDHIVRNPIIIYQQIQKNIEKFLVSEWILGIITAPLMYYLYRRIKSLLQVQVVHAQPRLFIKNQDEVVQDSDLCIACMTNVRNTLILPCFHLICCQECLNQIEQGQNQCPLCRTYITQQKQLLVDNIY